MDGRDNTSTKFEPPPDNDGGRGNTLTSPPHPDFNYKDLLPCYFVLAACPSNTHTIHAFARYWLSPVPNMLIFVLYVVAMAAT